MTIDPAARQDLFVVGLRNIHAVEKQSLSIMTPQIARIDHYPADRLRRHLDETNRQIAHVDETLATLDTSASALKDVGLGPSVSMAAIARSVAGDEILKNSFVNYAFEHFESASYKSRLTLADDVSFDRAVTLLRESLAEEEEAMARWIDDALRTITRHHADLYAERIERRQGVTRAVYRCVSRRCTEGIADPLSKPRCCNAPKSRNAANGTAGER